MKLKSKLIDVYELEPTFFAGGDTMHFRLEIFQSLCEKYFFPCVWFKEHYRVQPTLPQSDQGDRLDIADELLYAEDAFGPWDEMRCVTPDQVISQVLESIAARYRGVDMLHGENNR